MVSVRTLGGWLWLAVLCVVPYALRVVPDVKRHEIGVKLIEQMASFSGKPCRSDSGNKALNLLSQRLLGAQERLWVLPTGVAQTAHVPGGLILLNREVLEDFEDLSEGPGGKEDLKQSVDVAAVSVAISQPEHNVVDRATER